MLAKPRQLMQPKQQQVAKPMGQKKPTQPPAVLKPLQPPVQQPSPWMPPNMQQQMPVQVPTLPSHGQASLNPEIIKRYLQS